MVRDMEQEHSGAFRGPEMIWNIMLGRFLGASTARAVPVAGMDFIPRFSNFEIKYVSYPF